MRKPLILAAALLLAHVVLLAIHPRGAQRPPTGEGLDVGIVFDVGGRGDKSFNDGAYLGGERAERELGARVHFVEPGEGSDREAGLRLLAAEGMDIVIGVGFIFTDDLTALAREYPNTHFAGVDYALATDDKGNVVPPPANLAALKFREEQGSFLVGALAALVGKSTRIGFVGGMDIPLIHKFEAGYTAGVKYICRDCTVVAQYAGVTPEAFRNPGRGKELALAQYQSGANVIFHASGSTGLGVFEAARQTGKLAIGVDADQYAEAPGHILTSMVKGVDASVYDVIKRVKDGTFKGGVYWFGLAEQGVGYVYDANNRALIPDSVRSRLESIRQDIVAGRIDVPSTRSR
ncbi:MAG TPA: BMP family ABC transporter substrate-binding protein [Gemmatimonadaceae bacterium]|nr:BMP family ABC transporter substrate-binding protein [Gemmatimonadaceae bacterium]